jgi:transposase InsO family protein
MQLHGNARTCPASRALIVDRVARQHWSVGAAAAAAGVSERTAAKWLARWRAEGTAGLQDRSSAPRRVANRSTPELERAVEALRRLRMTAAEIAECLGVALSTVSAICRRVGLGKRSRLDRPEPANRYQRRHPGELLHVDIKKLGRIERAGHRAHGDRRTRARGAGWEFVYVGVDDASRFAVAAVLPDEQAVTATAFLRRLVTHFQRHGVTAQRVMTDNGSPFVSTLFARACRQLGLRHLRTRPYRPRTNGKAERFIQTLINGWAYARVYGTSHERTDALPTWLEHYNHRRPHGSLSHQPPALRLNNLLGNYT